MQHPIQSLHHVTATVDGAQEDLDFYRSGLGLRLVKRTVNFDNHNVYHFYYGTEAGAPGTIWTTFPYRGWGVRTGVKGAGQIVATSFSAPSRLLGIWKARLRSQGIAVEDAATRFGEECIRFYDPSGLAIELVGANQDDRTPWASGDIEPDAAIRGLHSVTLSIRSLGPTVKLLRELLGFEIVDQGERRTRMGVHGGGPGKTVDLLESPDALPAVNGIGTVHHVAFAISSAEEQLRLREELLGRGYQVTEVRDRTYFQSIYFREPGGVLLEVATIQPGFTFDEELARLGEGLKLPPWEEPHRSQIEATLPDVK